jgi:hypothetical protein
MDTALPWRDTPTTCLVCGAQALPPVTEKGWRLAPNRIGGYVCSVACDQVILDYDEEQKELKKKAKKAKKQAP